MAAPSGPFAVVSPRSLRSIDHPWKWPALSGLLFGIAYLFFRAVPLLALVGLVPLLAWIDARGGRGWRASARGAAAFGLALNLFILHWMYSMLWMSWLAVLAYLGLAAVFAIASGGCVLVLQGLRRRTGWSFAVLLPAVWIPIEWLQALGDLRMTAQHVAHMLAGAPWLVQFADLTGPYGVGAVLLATNALVYETWRGFRRRRPVGPAAALALLAVAVAAYDTWSLSHPPKVDGTVNVGLIQPNVSLLEKMDPATDDAQLAVLSRLSVEAAARGATLIVWPETGRPKPFVHRAGDERSWALRDVAALAQRTGSTFLVGAEYVEWDPNVSKAYNAAFVVHPDGTLDPRWTAKRYLVPFVEGVPFSFALGPLLRDLRGGALHWLAGGFEPGPPQVLLPAAGARIGATVCFEELYFDLHRGLRNAGAEFQVVLTNHAWFRRSLFQRYAADVVRLRAIENRSAFVRAANTGYSGFVDPLGRYHAATALFEKAVETMVVPRTSVRTLYDRIGDWPAWSAWAVLGLAALAAIRKEREEVP